MYSAVLFMWEERLWTLTAYLLWLAPWCFLWRSLSQGTEVWQPWEGTTQISLLENELQGVWTASSSNNCSLGISHSIYARAVLSLGYSQAMTEQDVPESDRLCSRQDSSTGQALPSAPHPPGPDFLRALLQLVVTSSTQTSFLPSLP